MINEFSLPLVIAILAPIVVLVVALVGHARERSKARAIRREAVLRRLYRQS